MLDLKRDQRRFVDPFDIIEVTSYHGGMCHVSLRNVDEPVAIVETAESFVARVFEAKYLMKHGKPYEPVFRPVH